MSEPLKFPTCPQPVGDTPCGNRLHSGSAFGGVRVGMCSEHGPVGYAGEFDWTAQREADEDARLVEQVHKDDERRKRIAEWPAKKAQIDGEIADGLCKSLSLLFPSDASALVTAIRAGKIPFVKIDETAEMNYKG